jgi:hypothetical protein
MAFTGPVLGGRGFETNPSLNGTVGGNIINFFSKAFLIIYHL